MIKDARQIVAGAQLRHHSGRNYTVIAIANKGSADPVKFPVSAVYIGVNGRIWTRSVDSMVNKFEIVDAIYDRPGEQKHSARTRLPDEPLSDFKPIKIS